MIRVLLVAGIALTATACSHVGNEPHRDRRAELPMEHPLNGTWEQVAKGNEEGMNSITFDTIPLDRYWQVRGGTYSGDLANGDDGATDFAWDGYNVYHNQDPQHGYAGTAEVTYNTDVFYADDQSRQYHRNHTDYCNYAVSDDHRQVTFSNGCVLFSGTYNKTM